MSQDNFDLDNYVPVNTRLKQFRDEYAQGFITTEAVNMNYGDMTGVRFTAKVFRNLEEAKVGVPASTGHAESILENEKVLEWTETTAIGRALAILGYSIEAGVASREEMSDYQANSTPEEPTPERQERKQSNLDSIRKLQNKTRSSFKR